MSEVGEDKASNVPVPYQVGYGKPPMTTRFQKGKSGNPRGRPRKQRKEEREPALSFAAQRANQLLMSEAYRPVTIREGERVIELPAIQAVFRSMGVSAMKGNRFAQRTLADLVREVEEEDRKLNLEYLDASMDYKIRWEKEIERCRKAGLPEPQPLPHPDDVIIDVRKGTVRMAGPMTAEEKKEWDLRLARRDEAQAEVSYYADRYRKARSDDAKASALQDWHVEQYIFDIINDSMPDRYKTKLQNRSYRKDASREGNAIEQFRKMK